MSEKTGIVTGGGDCPDRNTVIRAVPKSAAKRGWEAISGTGSPGIARRMHEPARALGASLGD